MYKVFFYRKKSIYKNNERLNSWQSGKLHIIRFSREFTTLDQLARYMVSSKHLITSVFELTNQEIKILEQKVKALSNNRVIRTAKREFQYV